MAKLSSYLRGSTTTTGINTSSNLVINSGSATGTASQNLQVIGGAYVSSNTGIGTTNPQAPLHVVGTGATTLFVNGNARITGILSIGQGTLTIDGDGGTVTGLSTITGSTNYSKPNLAGISSTISSTAVDIFVYDTRKDSDGGQWRKRTQHTSWYNETLNTATRGSRRDFPAVAVIVATTSSVTIYDGDDPDMPMWMVFNRGVDANPTMWWDGNNSNVATSVIALNGLMMLTTSSAGSYGADFIGERWIYFYNQQTNSGYRNNGGGLVNRNSAVSSRIVTQEFNGYAPSANANDVAMTVLPNAPIDSATGLPVPTIAVATNGGVSVIKDDGTVISTSGSGYYVKKINFTKDYGLNVIINNSDGTNWINAYVNDYTTINGLSYITYNNFDGVVYRTKYDPKALTYLTASTNDTISNFISLDSRSNAIGGAASGGGLTFFEKSPKLGFDPDSGIVAFATTSYNTGWMHGDIKGAWLSDTSTASVTGTELVTNGTFTTNTTGWTADGSGTTTFSVVSSALSVSRVTGGLGSGAPYQNITLTAGVTYTLSYQITSGDMTVTLYDGTIGGSTIFSRSGSTTGWYNDTFTVSTTGTKQLIFIPNNQNTTAVIDNVSIRVAERDRSVNNKSLAVYGTITKSAVATGSNLVAYSGFSTTNYLAQPYNSSLVAGTGSQCFMGWVYATTDTNLRYVFCIGRQDSAEQFRLGFSNSATYFDYGNGSQYIQWSKTITSGTWNFVVAMVTAGQVGKVFINGVELTSPSSSAAAPSTFSTDTTYITTVGTLHEYVNGISVPSTTGVWNGSISLVRYSLSAPSPTQIAKIYNDEKVLFQQNAACTLYGSSDAVTALAYDEVNDLLHVGTSSGRSDFNGLRRINNTTTAVTTAISAYDGLIAAQ